MKKLPVLGCLRRLPLTSLVRRSTYGQAFNNQRSLYQNQGPVSPLLEKYRSMRKTQSKSNVWTSLQSSRTYPTMSKRLDKSVSSKRSKSSYANYFDGEVNSCGANRAHTNIKPLAKENVKGRAINVDKKFAYAPAKRELKKEKLVTPTHPIMRVFNQKGQLAKAQSTSKDSPKVQAFPSFQFNTGCLAKGPVNTVKHTSAMPCETILQKFAAPQMSYLKATNRAQNYLAIRPAQPLKLKVRQPKTEKISAKQPEQEFLNHLLGDLLHKKPGDPDLYSIKFNKVSPLCKVVTNSMERRCELHTHTFKKQLEVPELYKHPSIGKYQKPTGGQRRTLLKL